MSKVSVIVPVYGTEKYLDKCITSIINQTLNEIEIIILNDGSPDNSEEIISQYAESDDRIRYYKHENIGLGPTRNRGIELATGEYLAFIDSDDYIELNMLELLFKEALFEQSDIVCSEVFIASEKICYVRKKFNKETIDLKESDKEVFFREYYFGRIYSHNACDKIYKTSFVKENNIMFGNNKKVFAEDNYFQFQVLSYRPKISFVPKPFYYYVIRNGSIMNSYKRNLIERHLAMIESFKSMNATNDVLIQKIIDVLTFDGLIAEVINVVESRKALYNLRNSFKVFYNSKHFDVFLKSMNKNKAYLLEPNKIRRKIMNLSSRLFEFRLNFVVEVVLYIKYKYFR